MMENYLQEINDEVWSSFSAGPNTQSFLVLGILTSLMALSVIRRHQRSRTVRRLNAAIDAYTQLDR